jgi:hypothetical protein
MVKMNRFKNFYFLILLFGFLFLFPNLSFGAEIFFEGKDRQIAVNQLFEVEVFLNTETENINAIEGKFVFPAEFLELREVRDGNSIINFWIERPKISLEGEITFSGITPGGYSGNKGLIFSLIFQSKREGEGILTIRDSRVFLNDGLGTRINLPVSKLSFSIKKEIPPEPLPEIPKDTMPPESFLPQVAQAPEIFGGKYFLVFATQDKGSGIAEYFVFETSIKRTKIYENEWKLTQSPYLLKDQKLRSYVYVRAKDRAGNERVAMVPPKNPLAWYENCYFWFIIIGVIIYLVFRKFFGGRKNMKKRKKFSKKILNLLIFILFFGFGCVKLADAAFLYLSPSEGSFYKNENFTVSVLVNTEVSINAMEGVIIFPTEFLEAINVNTRDGTNSIIDLWVQNPSFSNAGKWGNVRFEGVTLNPGFVGPAGKIIEIVFRIKKEGSVDLSFTDFAILANDGLGTNVSTPDGKAHFIFLPARVSPREAPLQPLQKEDIKAVEEKIKSLEKKIGEISPETEIGILRFWRILPSWLKNSILVLIGIAVFLLILIILSFGIIVLIWLWSRFWGKRKKIFKWFSPKTIGRLFRKIFIYLGWAREEFGGDVEYSINLIRRDLRKATDTKTLGRVLTDYWNSILKIIRRFRKKNIPKP